MGVAGSRSGEPRRRTLRFAGLALLAVVLACVWHRHRWQGDVRVFAIDLRLKHGWQVDDEMLKKAPNVVRLASRTLLGGRDADRNVALQRMRSEQELRSARSASRCGETWTTSSGHSGRSRAPTWSSVLQVSTSTT
jgi:hypothetical protein